MLKQGQQLGQLATWLAIVSQLYSSRMEQLLGKHRFTTTQFGVLVHLARNAHEQHTISSLTAAVEVNQPGVTKIVKKLGGLGLVQSERDSADSRKKHVSITSRGLATIGQIQQELAPDVSAWFADWTDAERQSFLQQLQVLGAWFDANRL